MKNRSLNSVKFAISSGCWLIFVSFTLSYLNASPLPVQAGQDVAIVNPGFEDGVNGWQPHLHPQVKISASDDAIEGAGSCLVSQREFSWAGVKQNLLDKLQVDNDYRISLKAKSASGDAAIKIQARQKDDRGTKFIELGTLLLSSNSWSTFEGGFHLQTNGKLQELDLLIAGAVGHTSDFIIDDVSVSLNDWKSDAAARIEAIRKTDLVLSVVSESGDPLLNAEVDAQQIRSHFAFGSTMNSCVGEDQEYADFFKEHFEWATVEWRLQWKPVEEVQGVEVYDLGDQAVEFCEANDIKLRGHSIVWPHSKFVPKWLPPLSDAEVLAEVNERVENVATRYRGRLASWDVCNEMLDHRFYRDRLGDDIVAHIYRETRRFAPNADLFINETGFLDRCNEFRNKELIDLVKDLQASGADVGGLGMQSHFFVPNVSPATMELVLEQLAEVDLPIWISEYDTVNPDPLERAKQLETFYRYVFSRPEVDGIIMWGFWAGAHWRGKEAALVDRDWTINAAGEMYLKLIEEWTTSKQGATDQSGEFKMRGFQGTYRVQARNPETDALSQHIVYLPPLGGKVQETQLVLPDDDGVISIYGSAGDDEIKVRLQDLTKLTIGDQIVPLPADGNVPTVRFYGLGGDDRLTIEGLPSSQPAGDRYFFRMDELRLEQAAVTIQYEGVECVRLRSQRDDDLLFMFDSPGDDRFVSTAELTTMITPEVRLEAEQFYITSGKDGAGNDKAMLTDSTARDTGFSNLLYMSLADGKTIRRAVGFEQNEMVSVHGGNDWLTVSRPNGKKSVGITPRSTEISMDGHSYKFNGFPLVRLLGANNNSDILEISDSFFGDEYLFIRDNFLHLDSDSTRVLASQFGGANVTGSFSGNDVLRIRDTAVDDLLLVDEDSLCLLSRSGAAHFVTGFDRVEAVGNQGGTNSANLGTPGFELELLGVWELIE